MTVTTSGGASNSTKVKIFPGNAGPTPVIASPSPTLLYTVGQQLTLNGSATDAAGNPITGDKLTWEVFLHHLTHTHPLLQATHQNPVQITARPPEDLLAATNSYIEIRLTAVDANGLSKTLTQNVMPHKVDLSFQSSPAGQTLLIGGTRFSAPATVTSWENNPLDIEALDGVAPSGEPLAFTDWSDGGARAHALTTPAGPTTYTATYSVISAPTFPPVDDARVRKSSPTTNYGRTSALSAKSGSAAEASFLRFNVAGLAGAPTYAKLYLYVSNGSVDGPSVFAAGDGWTETGITWNNQPATSGPALDSIGPVGNGVWRVLDVTAAVRGNGPVNLALIGDSTDSLTAPSREATSRQPRLVVAGASSGDANPPSAPTNLAGDPSSSSTVDLTWTASTDIEGAIAGYDLYRNGTLLTTVGPAVSFSDTTTAAQSTYAYKIRARDASGNVSGFSADRSVTTPAPTTTFVLSPTDDARVSAAAPGSIFGRSTQLRTQGGSGAFGSYLKFSVPTLSGSIYRAQLRVYVASGSTNGSVDGPAVYTSGSTWSETGITWSNRPARSSSAIADVGAISGGSWVTYDVAAAITGNNLRTFALAQGSIDDAAFSSKEGSNPPQLIITTLQNGFAINAAGQPDGPAASPVATGSATAAAVVTPSPTASAVATLPFSDGFESGELGQWTPAAGFAIEQDTVATGAFAVRATSGGSADAPGQAADATRSLGEPQTEVYARVAVNLPAAPAADLDLLALLDRRDTPLVTLVATADGKIALRNGASRQVTAFADLPPAAWHALQIHLAANGARRRIEVWLDGKLVVQSPIRLTSRPISSLRLGDPSLTKTFSVAFDDVAVDRVCIGACPSDLATPEPSPTAAAPEPTATPQPSPTDVPTAPATERTAPVPTATDPPPTETPTPEPQPTEVPPAEVTPTAEGG